VFAKRKYIAVLPRAVLPSYTSDTVPLACHVVMFSYILDHCYKDQNWF